MAILSSFPIEARYRMLARGLEDSSVGLTVTSAIDDYPILYANPAFLDMTGYGAEEVIGKNCRFLQGQDTDREAREEIRNAIAECRELMVEILNYRKDGSSFWNLIHILPIRDDDGKVQYFFGYQRDVTRRRIAEQGLQQALKLEALGRLTGGLAHDFNNFLQVIVGSCESLERRLQAKGHATEDVMRPLRTSRRAIDKASELTRQLLAFSRRQRLNMSALQVNELIAGIQSMLTQSLGDHIHVLLELTQALWFCQADMAQLETTILNIAINARDAMEGRRHQKLTIRTANRNVPMEEAREMDLPPGQYVEVTIVDNGPGIPKDILKRILDPFFTTKGGKGTGLGLCIAHGIARQSGGTLYVDSVVGLGTSVHILLPRSAAPAEEQSSGAALGKTVTLSQALRILLVDDNQEVAETLGEILALSGAQVRSAFSADEAMDVLSRERFDVLMTDVMMPGSMDGIELAQAAVQKYPHMRVILVSGHIEAEREREHDWTGFRVLYKPLSAQALVEAINESAPPPGEH